MPPGGLGWDAFVVRYAGRGSAGLNADDTRVSAITLTLGVTDRAGIVSSLRPRVENPKDPFAPPVLTGVDPWATGGDLAKRAANLS